MAVNLIGQPSETTGAAHAASTVLLGLHVVVAAGLLAGVMTVITKNNWWSYTMAAGFIASILLYGNLLVRAQNPAPQPEQPN